MKTPKGLTEKEFSNIKNKFCGMLDKFNVKNFLGYKHVSFQTEDGEAWVNITKNGTGDIITSGFTAINK